MKDLYEGSGGKRAKTALGAAYAMPCPKGSAVASIHCKVFVDCRMSLLLVYIVSSCLFSLLATPIHRKASMSTGQPDLRYLENNKTEFDGRGVKPHESNQPMLFKGVNPTRNAQPSMFLLCACVHHLNGS
jgi:hypothetical protein